MTIDNTEQLATASRDRSERRDASENRRRLLAVARVLFAERGVDAVSMHDLAQAADIGQGTLYRRYPNKAMLCAALLEENLAQFSDLSTAKLAHAGDTVPAIDQLRALLDELLAFVEANGALLSGMGDSACGATPEDHYQHPWMVWQRQTMSELIDRAVASNEISPIDTEATVDLIQSACEPHLYIFQRQNRGYTRERVVANLIRLVAGTPPA